MTSDFKEKLKDIGKVCIPGMRLSESNKEFVSGSGTYELKGYIYASLAGVLKMEEDDNSKVGFLEISLQWTDSMYI